MKTIELLKRLEESEEFKSFKESDEGKDAFLCAGFFVLNFKSNIFDYSLDFRNESKIFSFKIPETKDSQIIIQAEDLIQAQKPLEKINPDVQIDIEQLREIVEKELQKNSIKNKLEEIIAVLQNMNGKMLWNLTIMCEGLTIINSHIDSEKGAILKFEKKNLLDFIKK